MIKHYPPPPTPPPSPPPPPPPNPLPSSPAMYDYLLPSSTHLLLILGLRKCSTNYLHRSSKFKSTAMFSTACLFKMSGSYTCSGLSNRPYSSPYTVGRNTCKHRQWLVFIKTDDSAPYVLGCSALFPTQSPGEGESGGSKRAC